MQLTKPYPVYIELKALIEVVLHALEGLPNEVIGFLIGTPYVWDNSTYVYVTAALRGRTEASETHVEFAADSLGEVVQWLRRNHPNAAIVGWYHSHPGYGCFLSPTDLASHMSCFTMPYHVAMVVDPMKGEAAFFKVVSPSEYEQVCSAVVRRKENG
jgi:proteasome lid subunit RPN8/RPN11